MAPDNGSGAPGTFANYGTSTANLSATVTGLTSGTTYWFQVIATDSESPAVSITSNQQFGVTNFISTATFNPALPIQNLPTTAGDVITVPLGSFSPGSSPITSVSLYAGSTSGSEAASPVATITSPTFPLSFGPQARPIAGQSVYYVVKTSDGHALSPASNELRSTTTAIAPTGNTEAQTFTAPYGQAYSGQASLGYTVYDPTGAVILPHTLTGVGEIPGTGIYSASVPLDAADYGTLVWDAPSGAAPIVQSFSVAAAQGSAGNVLTVTQIAAAVTAALLVNPASKLQNDSVGRLLLQPAQPGVTIPVVGSIAGSVVASSVQNPVVASSVTGSVGSVVSLPAEFLSQTEQNSLQAAAAQATQANAQATQANSAVAGIPSAVLSRSIGHGMTVGQLLVLLQATDAANVSNAWNPYTHILTTSYQFTGDTAATRTDTTPFPATQVTNPGVVGRSTTAGSISQP